MNLSISNEAAIDLENNTFENWSIEQADRYLNLILDEIEYLYIKPDSGFDSGNIRKGYFRSKVKSHVIFYRINHKQDELEVIRILHEMMDVEKHLIK